MTDATDVSILIPSNLDQREAWLKHALRFLARGGHTGEILVGIWGGHAKIPALTEAVRAIAGPRIRIISQDGARRFTDRIFELAREATSPFIIAQGDDDFLVPAAFAQPVALLRKDLGVACAQGRIIQITLGDKLTLPFTVTGFPMWNAPETDVVARFGLMMKHYTFLWHAVFRRAQFIERAKMMDDVAAATHDEVFWERIGDMYGVIKGRVVIFEELYMVRGEHPQNAMGRTNRILNFRGGALLPLSPHFTPSYKFFEARVLAMFTEAGVDVSDELTLHKILTGMMNFLKHTCFKARGDVEPGELAFLKSLNEPAAGRIFQLIFDTQAG